MTLDYLRNKLVRILTRPPEFLYALSRHWFLTAACLVTGAVCMWFVVRREPLVYEGHAQLFVAPPDPAVKADLEAISGPVRRETIVERRSFLHNQITLLRSERVLGLVADRIISRVGAEALQRQASGDEMESLIGVLQRFKQEVTELIAVDERVPEGARRETDETESLRQRIMLQFAKRCVAEAKGNETIDLYVYHFDRSTIEAELQDWIDMYKRRREELLADKFRVFLDNQSEYYESNLETAQRALQSFRQENPEVSTSKVEDLQQRILQVQDDRAEARRYRRDLTDPGEDTVRVPNPVYTQLLQDRSRVELQIDDLRASGVPETSTEFARATRQLQAITAKLEGVEPYDVIEAPQDDRREAAIAEAQARIEALDAQLESLWKDKARVASRLDELEDLDDEYDDARAALERFETMRARTLSLQELRRALNVQVSQEPSVGQDPVRSDPLVKIAVGAAMGAFVGLLITIFFELLYARVRFKHDLIEAFNLPVVSVFPK